MIQIVKLTLTLVMPSDILISIPKNFSCGRLSFLSKFWSHSIIIRWSVNSFFSDQNSAHIFKNSKNKLPSHRKQVFAKFFQNVSTF